jgi:thioredoxin 1
MIDKGTCCSSSAPLIVACSGRSRLCRISSQDLQNTQFQGKESLVNVRWVLCVAAMAIIVFVLSPCHVYSEEAADSKRVSPVPRLVDIGADKCIPCIMMAPVLEELKKEYAGVLDVEFVDAWKDPNEARKYNVRGIPTQIFYDVTGKEVARHMGFISKKDILRKFEQLKIPLIKTQNNNR